MTSRTLRLVMLATLSVATTFASTSVRAHDYWLQADNYHPAPGERLIVHLNFGDSLAAQEERAYEVERTERFELRFAADVRNLAASTPAGLKPVFADTLASEGAFLFSLVGASASIEMSAEEFNEHLDHEGIGGQRAQQATQRERSWRFLKLLGRSGADNETDLHHRFTGAQFEIVLLQNPFTLQLGDEQIVQLLFDTNPLAGATVFALHRGADGALKKLSAVTDARGVVRFNLDQPGMWLIRSAHLRPCKGCKDADWESFRAAYSFALE